jgi:hypothetical protein
MYVHMHVHVHTWAGMHAGAGTHTGKCAGVISKVMPTRAQTRKSPKRCGRGRWPRKKRTQRLDSSDDDEDGTGLSPPTKKREIEKSEIAIEQTQFH